MNNSQVQKNFVTEAPVKRNDIKLTVTVGLPDGHNMAYQIESSGQKSDPRRLTVRYKNLRSMLDELIVLYNVVNKAQSSLDVKFDYLKFKLHLEARQESWLLSQKEDLGKLIEDKTLFFGQLTNMCQVQIIFEIIKLLKEQSWPVPPKLPSLIRKFIQLINQNCDPESHETELDNIVRMSESLIKEIENPPLPEKVEQLLFDSQDPKSIQENTIHSFFDNSQNNYMNYDSVDGQNIEGSLGLYSDRGQQQPIPKSAFVRPNRTYSTPPKHQSSNPFDNPDPRAHSTSRTPFDDPSPPRGVNHNPFSPPREAHTPTNSLNYPQKIEVSNNPFENNSPRDNLTKSLQDPMAPWYNTSADLTSVNITSNTSASNFNPQIGNNPYIDISRGAPQWPNGYVVIPDTTSPYNSTHFQKTSNLHQDHPGDRTGPTPNFTPNSSNHAFKPAPVQFNPYLQTNTNSSNTARNPYSDPRPTQPAQKKPEEPLRNQPIINNPFANQTPLPEVVVQRKPEPQPQPRPEPQPQPRPEPQPQPNQGPSKPVPRPQPAPVTPTPSITSPTEPNSKLITANPVPSQKPVNPPTNTQNPNKPENSKQLFISKTTQKENIAKSNLEKKEDGPSNTSKPTKYIDAFKQNDRMLHKLPNNLEQENCWKFRKWLYLRNEESKWLDMLVSESITNKHTNYKILDFLFRFNTSNIHDKETDNRRLGKSELIETYKKILEQIKMKGASYDPYNLTMIASQLGDACPDTKVYFSTEFIELIKSNVYKIQEAAYDKYIEMYVSNPDSMIPLFILYTLATQNYTTFREKIGTSALPGLKDSKAVLVRKVLGLFEHLKDHFQTEQVFEKHLITVTNLLSLEAKKDKRVTLLKSEDASTNILSYIEQYQDKSQFKGVHIKFIAYASAYSYPRSINELKVMFDALRNDFKVKLLDERENKREDYGLFWSVLKDKISFESNKDFPEEIVNHLNLTWNLSKDSKDTYESSKSISERIDELMAEGKDHEFAGLPAFLIKQESNRSNEMGIILKQYRDAITNWYAKDILEMKITKSRAKNLQSTILKDSKGKLEENLKFWCDAFKIDVLKNTKEGPSLFGQKWSLCCHLLSDSDAIDKAAASIETFGVKLELLKCPMNKHDPELSSYNLFSILQKDCPGLFKMANLKGSKTIEKFIHDQFENPGMNMNLLKKNIDEFSAKWAENIKEWSTNQVNDSTIKEMENLSGFNEHLLMEIGAFFGFMRDKDQDLIQTVQDTCLMYKSLLNFEEFQRDFSLLDEFISNQKDPQKYIRFSKEDFAQLKKVSEVVIREKKLMVNYKELTEGGKKALILFSKERRLFDLIVPCLDLIKHFLKIRDRTVHMSMLKEKTEANVTKDGISDLIRLINYWERARTSSKPHEPYTAHRVMSSIREFYSNDLKDLKSSKSRPLDLVLIKKSGEALITASKILQTENMEAELDGILSKGTYILEPKDSQKTGHSYALRFELTDGDKKIEVSHKKLEEFERIISGQSNQGHESESKFNQENGEAFLEIYGTLNKAKRLLERLRSTGNILNLTKAIDKAKQETKITQIEVKQSEYLTTSKGRGTEYINLDEKEFRQFSSKIKVEKVSVKIDFEMNKRVRRGGDKNERKEEATASFPFHILCELLSHIEQANKVNNTREVSDKQVYWITYLEGRQKEFLANYTFMFLKSLPQKPKIQAEFEEEFTEIIEKRTFPEKPQPDQKGEIQKIKLVDRPTEYLLDYYDESQDIKADAILKFVRKDLLAHTFKNRLREHSVRLEDIDDSFSNNILKEVSFAIYEGEDIKRNNRVNEIMTTRKFYYYTYDNEREENGDRNLRLEVFFNCVEKTETDYTQLRPYNILLLNQESTMIEICTFLERAFYDSSGYWYFILDFHLLSAEIRAEFISFLRSMVKNDYQNYGSKRSNFHLLLLIDRHALKGSIADEIERKAQDILMYPRHWDIQNRKSDSVVNLLKGVPITLVTSDMAGLGKTHYIRKKAKGKLLRLFLSGDITEKNIVKRLGRLASTIQAEDESVFSLHVKMDMMENMMKNCERLDQLLFRILFLKYSPFGDSYLFFDKVDHFYVEISNNYKDFLLKELTIFSIFKDFQSKVVNIKGISFSTQMQEEGHPPIDLDDLQGPKDQNNQSENRIFYICRAHQLLQDNKIQTEELFLSPEYRHPEYSAQVKEDWLRTLHKIFLGNNRQGGNMTQFVSLIKNLYDDLKELNKIAAISLEVIRIETEGRAIKKDIDSILKVRSTLLKLVFESNVELVWSTVDFIRTENKMTKEFRDCGDKVTKDKLRTELKQLLDRYQNDIEHLPNFKSWEKGKKVMSFLRNGGVKLLSRDLSHIDPEVHEFFKIASGGIPIHDLQKFEIDEKEARARLEREGPQMNEKASHLIRVEYTRPFSKEKLVWTAENFQKFIIDELINFFEIRTSNHILEEDIRNFGNKKGYTFTCDNYIKILMILKRVNSKLPVVISGATGCGKSYLIEFIAKCLFKATDKFCLMTLHSGVTEQELEDFLIESIKQPEEKIKPPEEKKGLKSNNPNEGGEMKETEPPQPPQPPKPRRIWIFFDEFNTSPLQSLIEEIISENRASFTSKEIKFPPNIVFVAACNPFRIRANPSVVGLRPNATNFSHRVYPIPESLINFTWDFDQLSYESELKYADQMLKNNAQLQRYKASSPLIKGDAVITVAIACVMESQKYHRSQNGESTVSLRDITRFIPLFLYFSDLYNNDYFIALINAINLVYILRIPDQPSKDKCDELLSKVLIEQCKNAGIEKQLEAFHSLHPEVAPNRLFIGVFRKLSREMIQEIMHENIEVLDPNKEYILNLPLIENMYTFFACLANNIPCVACGKPGSSKSLGLTLCREILGLDPKIKSKSRFLSKMMKSLQMTEFWGSSLTTSSQVKEIFDKSEMALQSHRENKEMNDRDNKEKITEKQFAISMDELGLAEIADDNPLKILHPLLDNLKDIGFIGLSNWVMDISKMNRVLLISRNELTEADLSEIGRISVSLKVYRDKDKKDLSFEIDETMIQKRMQLLVKAYTEFIRLERGGQANEERADYLSNFFGARDLYGAVKYLNRNIIKMFQIYREYKAKTLKDEEVFDLLVSNAIDRNFSGKKKAKSPYKSAWELNDIYSKLAREDSYAKKKDPDVLSMIGQNLISDYSRHLMLFYDSYTTSKLLIDSLKGFIKNNLMTNENKIIVLNGITDEQEISNIINSLEVWISEGYTLIMKDMNRVYDCLYEILNLKYGLVTDETGTITAHCAISVNNIRVPVTVNKKFRCIVLMKQEDCTEKRSHVETQLPPPFLNRFEKHLVLLKDMFSAQESNSIQNIKSGILPQMAEKVDLQKCSLYIHNFSEELISSVIVDQDELMKRNKLKILSDDYYLEQLIDEKCNKDRTKVIKVLSQDEIKLKEKKASEALVELYSKNMLFYQAIASKVRNSEMEKQFIATHPDSLEKFMEPLISKAKIQKYILFTFSRNIELIEAIQRVEIKLNNRKTEETKVTIKSFSAEDFSKKSEEGPKSRLEGSKNLIENSVKVNTFTIIKFTDREMWRQMDKLREEVDKIAIPSQHFLFFIGMYSLEKDSLLEVQDRNSPITFSVADWKMVVIDNVYESNYPRFMKMMRNKDSQGAPMIPKQILMEDCSKHRNSRMVQLIQGEIKQKLIQCGINPREILALLKEKTSETIFSFIADRVISMNNDKLEDRPITELVRHSEYKELLLKNTDIDDVISDIMEKIFFPRIKIAIEVIHRKKGFTFLNSIYNSGELSHTVKKKLLEYWIDDVKSLSADDFKQNLPKNSLEAPSMIKVFRDVVDNNSKYFTDIYEEVSREKEREITFAAIRNKFESSNQEDQEKQEEGSDQEEVSSSRGVLFDMFEQYIQNIQVYLQYQAGKLEYDRDISIYTGVMLLENHCRNRHARWEPITKSVMYKLGTEYCKIFFDLKDTQTIPTANIVHAIFAFRYIFDKELEYLEANPNQIDGAIQGFQNTMFLSINRRKMEVSVRPFLNQSELDHNIHTLRVDLETLRLWKDGSKSLPKYTVELLLSIYETIIGMDYRSSDVLKAFMPIHNQELKRGTQSSKLIKIAHQFFKVLYENDIDQSLHRLTEVITIASKIITYTDVDPKESSQFILFIFDIFVSKNQQFFSKKHYENVLIISFLIASQLKMRVTEQGRMEFANPEISNYMLEQLDTRFQKKMVDFTELKTFDKDGEVDFHIKIYNRILLQISKQVLTQKEQPPITFSDEHVEEIFERFNQITKPIEVMSFESEQLMSNLNYLMLIQSIEDREDDEQRKTKLLQIDELIIPTEGNLSPIAVTLAKELHERELATQMTKLQSTMKELNRHWKFTFYPMFNYSAKSTVESLNKMLITKETSLTSNFSKYTSKDVEPFVLFTAAHFEIGIYKLLIETLFFKNSAKKPIVFIEEATTGSDPYSQEFIDQVHQIASREKCIVFMMQLCFTLAQKWDTKVLKAIQSSYQVLRRLTKSDEYRVFILIQLLIQRMSTEIKQGLGTASSIRSCILKSLKEITVPLIDDQIKKNAYFDKLKKEGNLSHLYLISKLVDFEVEYPILIYQRMFARERKVQFDDLISHLTANSEAEIHSEFIKIVKFSELYSEYKDILATILKFCKILKKNLNGKLRKGEAEQPISNWIGGGDEKKRKEISIKVARPYNPFEDEAENTPKPESEVIECDNPEAVRYQELSECYNTELVPSINKLKSILQIKKVSSYLNEQFQPKLTWGSTTENTNEFLDRITNPREPMSSFLVREEEISECNMRGLIGSVLALQNKLVDSVSDFFAQEYRGDQQQELVEFMHLRPNNFPELKGIKSVCLQHARYTYTNEGTPQISVELGGIMKTLMPRKVPKISFDSPTFYCSEDIEKLKIENEVNKFLRRHRIEFNSVDYKELQNLCDNLNIETNELENCELLIMQAIQSDKLQSLKGETSLSDLIGQDNLGTVTLQHLPTFIQYLNIKRFDKSSFQPLHGTPFDEEDEYYLVFVQGLNLLDRLKRNRPNFAEKERVMTEAQQSLYDFKSLAFLCLRNHEKQHGEVISLQEIDSTIDSELVSELNAKIESCQERFTFLTGQKLDFVVNVTEKSKKIADEMRVCELYWIVSTLLAFLRDYKVKTK